MSPELSPREFNSFNPLSEANIQDVADFFKEPNSQKKSIRFPRGTGRFLAGLAIVGGVGAIGVIESSKAEASQSFTRNNGEHWTVDTQKVITNNVLVDRFYATVNGNPSIYVEPNQSLFSSNAAGLGIENLGPNVARDELDTFLNQAYGNNESDASILKIHLASFENQSSQERIPLACIGNGQGDRLVQGSLVMDANTVTFTSKRGLDPNTDARWRVNLNSGDCVKIQDSTPTATLTVTITPPTRTVTPTQTQECNDPKAKFKFQYAKKTGILNISGSGIGDENHGCDEVMILTDYGDGVKSDPGPFSPSPLNINASHHYTKNGSYIASVKVTDEQGHIGVRTKNVNVNLKTPTPTATPVRPARSR